MAGIRSIGIVGAGTMGRGIAELAARSGLSVGLHDAIAGAARNAVAAIGETLDRDVAKGRLSKSDAADALARISAGSLDAIARADLVIEAIHEDLAAKQALFRDLSRLASAATIFATNTSSLAVGAIADAVAGPGRFAGMHFFNPPTRLRVVELVRGRATSEATIAALQALAAVLGLRALMVGDTPGFLVNHIGRGFTGEALRLFDEGIAPAAAIDRIAREALHFKMGPFELLDLVGLDVSAEVTDQLWRAFDEEPRFRLAPIARRRVKAGLLGRKSGHGFYEYDKAGRAMVEPETNTDAPPSRIRLVGVPGDLGPRLAGLFPSGLVTDDPGAIALVGPIGCDVATEVRRHGLDPARTVGIDPLFTDHVTLAGPEPHAASVASAIRATGHSVTVVADGPGMPAQRIAAMTVLIAAEAASTGIGTPEDIDAAARLALAYPQGPLELGDSLGAQRVADIAAGLLMLTGDQRWRPSPWLDKHVASAARLAQSLSPQQLRSN